MAEGGFHIKQNECLILIGNRNGNFFLAQNCAPMRTRIDVEKKSAGRWQFFRGVLWSLKTRVGRRGGFEI
jgi:hypothetical protein